MKQLPTVLGEEVSLHVNYLICRFKEKNIAYKINENQPGTWFTIKKTQVEGRPIEYQVHIRFDGKDHYNGGSDTVDVDLYVNEKEFEQLLQKPKQTSFSF